MIRFTIFRRPIKLIIALRFNNISLGVYYLFQEIYEDVFSITNYSIIFINFL